MRADVDSLDYFYSPVYKGGRTEKEYQIENAGNHCLMGPIASYASVRKNREQNR